MLRIIDWLKRINNGVAIAAGLVLLACVLLILIDILLREFGISFGGSEEISGYVMASVSSWGICYALTEKAHVRIDVIRNKGKAATRSIFDLIALAATSYVAVFAAYHVIPVVEKTLKRNSLANTSLETPLIIPQSIWMAGWIWFAITSCVLLVCAFGLMIKQKHDQVNNMIGTETE
ncbi:MAG: TRAP transporter small permease subunit [Marinomonas sp.]|uniref:TRAP transporter small permease subunit n=1 Tax=Marinomonas sp. GJ51-6 TaxID=2992802 RepID=UPI00293475C1|nr:TRAP transporter small permease subunit [Marinomonas sp. GJ51-6]WOD09100.1 TRAP transporter small permease subunit [Marinomonas sp. GJ51-6]